MLPPTRASEHCAQMPKHERAITAGRRDERHRPRRARNKGFGREVSIQKIEGLGRAQKAGIGVATDNHITPPATDHARHAWHAPVSHKQKRLVKDLGREGGVDRGHANVVHRAVPLDGRRAPLGVPGLWEAPAQRDVSSPVSAKDTASLGTTRPRSPAPIPFVFCLFNTEEKKRLY